MQDDLIAPQLAEDIAISRRELAEGKGIPHEVVFAELDKETTRTQGEAKLASTVGRGLRPRRSSSRTVG